MQAVARHITRARLFWFGIFALTWAFSSYSFQIYKALDARWIIRFPKKYQLNLDATISAVLDWLVNVANFGLFTFRDVTRAIAWLIEIPYQFLRNLLIEGFQSGIGEAAVQIAPSLSWIAVIATVVAIGHYARDWSLATLAGACFLYLAVFGQWDSAMITLASVLVAVPIGAVGGLGLGILAYRRPWVDRMLSRTSSISTARPSIAARSAAVDAGRFRCTEDASRRRSSGTTRAGQSERRFRQSS